MCNFNNNNFRDFSLQKLFTNNGQCHTPTFFSIELHLIGLNALHKCFFPTQTKSTQKLFSVIRIYLSRHHEYTLQHSLHKTFSRKKKQKRIYRSDFVSILLHMENCVTIQLMVMDIPNKCRIVLHSNVRQ